MNVNITKTSPLVLVLLQPCAAKISDCFQKVSSCVFALVILSVLMAKGEAHNRRPPSAVCSWIIHSSQSKIKQVQSMHPGRN